MRDNSRCDSWDDLELFGRIKLNTLRRYLPYENGAPSDDTLRRFFRALTPAHLKSAFATELNLTLGQVKTADKSNEITAIPELLELLDIAGGIITIDAMGCQTKIAKKS